MNQETNSPAEKSTAISAGARSKTGAGFSVGTYVLMALVTLAVMIVCIMLGSVNIPLRQTLSALWSALTCHAAQAAETTAGSIILKVRLPQVLCAALTGASLSLCGAAMQGLLRNPLADGSTLGVSSGASLGAALTILWGITIPGSAFGGTMVMAILFSFLSLILIIFLSLKLDHSLSTNTIILIGIVYSMFVSAILSLVITFAGDKVKTIVFWTMGSLSGASYQEDLVLLAALVICGGILLNLSEELNAFAIGEDNARSIGVNVRRVKLAVLITMSVLIGVCVSIGGSIGFVGLITPHMVRLISGPNHKKLLPASLFGGAVFLMLADLIARTLLRPRVLPIGVVTSMIGAVTFLVIFSRSRRRQS